MKKPPLGLMPKYIWNNHRISEILAAIRRFSEANMPIPLEWVDELIELYAENKISRI